MNGLHFSDAKAGRVFTQTTTPLGLAIPIYTGTAIGGAGINAQPLHNPAGSGVEVELISHDITYASGTADYGSIVLMAGPLSAVGGTVCTAFATTVPLNGYLGGGVAPKCASSNGAGTVTVAAGTAGAPAAAAAGIIRTLASFNLEAVTGTAHGAAGFTYNWNGTLLIPEGWMVYLAATKATVALLVSTLVWKEIPTR